MAALAVGLLWGGPLAVAGLLLLRTGFGLVSVRRAVPDNLVRSMGAAVVLGSLYCFALLLVLASHGALDLGDEEVLLFFFAPVAALGVAITEWSYLRGRREEDPRA
jgi:hypothetical protein